MSQEFDPPAATQQAEPAAGPPSGTTRLVTWHDDLVVWVDQLGWLRTVNDWLPPPGAVPRTAPGQSGP